MNAMLVPCASCARHRRVEEAACPFCGAAGVEPVAPRGAPRVALAAALAAVAACRDPGRGADIYGAPPPVGTAATAAPSTAGPTASASSGTPGVKPNQFSPLVLGSKPPWESSDDAGAGDPQPVPRPRPRYGAPPDPARVDAMREAPVSVEPREPPRYEV